MSTNATTDNVTTEKTTKGTLTHRIRARLESIAALAGAGGAWSSIGRPSRPLAPVSPSMTMRITNHSAVPQILVSADPDGGWWVQAPRPMLMPGQTHTVIAATHGRGQFVQLNYIAENPRQSEITYALHTSEQGTDQASTGVSNQDFIIRATISQRYPDAAAQFDLA